MLYWPADRRRTSGKCPLIFSSNRVHRTGIFISDFACLQAINLTNSTNGDLTVEHPTNHGVTAVPRDNTFHGYTWIEKEGWVLDAMFSLQKKNMRMTGRKKIVKKNE